MEAQAASALDHPNICTIHEIDETPDGRLFLAMAFYEGETLASASRAAPLPVADAIRHRHPMPHGPSRPPTRLASFIATSSPPTSFCAPIGAAAAGRDRGRCARHRPTHRRDGVGEAARFRHRQAHRPDRRHAHRINRRHRRLHGARAHRRPSRSTSMPTSGRWVSSCTSCSTGKRPFGGDNALAIMRSITEDRPPRPGSLRPDVPPERSTPSSSGR